MDFGHFGDGPRDPQSSQQPPTPVNTTPSTPLNGAAASVNGNGAGMEQQIFMHTMEHPGVTCDNCNASIRGFRYKCMECVDYDLCTSCERKGNHPGHVMMRIAFPEQARGAIHRYLGIGGERRPGTGGLFGMGMGFPFETHGHRHRERGCHRRGGPGHSSARDSDGDSGPEDPKAPNDCPYGLGRRGMKKWAKCMKKMAYQQRRSADAYAKSATQAAGLAGTTFANATNGAQSGTQGASETQQQFDFTAAASQIQEFLNAFGIPIDVVELYDNFGNRGQPRAESGNSTQPETPSTPQNAGGEAPVNQDNPISPQAAPIGFEGALPPTNLAAHMQQLDLSGSQGPAVISAPSAPEETSTTPPMDMDADSSGWTLLDTDRPQNTGSVEAQPNAATEIPLNFGLPLAATSEASNGNFGTAGSVPPTPTPTGRLYPGLNPPQLQQLLSGVSQAMNSMVRNIPIVTNPGGPGMNSGPPSGNGPELDVRCTTTLNQLLAMGFSNHDGWLSRLVVAKNGDLEAVLNALFPVGGGQ